MLYGIRTDLQSRLVRQGYRVRVYIPFGKDWFPYFMRRLAERPANLLFFAKNFVSMSRKRIILAVIFDGTEKQQFWRVESCCEGVCDWPESGRAILLGVGIASCAAANLVI